MGLLANVKLQWKLAVDSMSAISESSKKIADIIGVTEASTATPQKPGAAEQTPLSMPDSQP